MTKRIFQFNPLLYRVCNQRTWELLEHLDGQEVHVTGPPVNVTIDDVRALVNSCRSQRQPDGMHILFSAFNSELAPIPEPTNPGPTA